MWIYFGSKRTGRWETWKVRADGGEVVQVTRNGGQMAFESPDGRFIYYTKDVFSGGRLRQMPVTIGGGEESQALPPVAPSSFSVANDGIYLIPEPGVDGKSSIQFLSFATGRLKTVAAIRISGPPTEGLSVSPDGRFLLFSQADSDVTT